MDVVNRYFQFWPFWVAYKRSWEKKILPFQVQYGDYLQAGHTMSLSNKNISLSTIQRGYYDQTEEHWSYFKTVYVPPPLELYTKLSLQSYFLIFLGILFAQTFTILVCDKALSKTIPHNTTWWERIIYAITKSNIPLPLIYWHEINGDQNEHIKRQKDTEFEILLTICINLFFNMVLLLPLVILCK